eukprot:2123615-Prymnesium_polylepis.1
MNTICAVIPLPSLLLYTVCARVHGRALCSVLGVGVTATAAAAATAKHPAHGTRGVSPYR